MIKIEKIRPMNSSNQITLDDLKTRYLTRVKKNTSPYRKLNDLISGLSVDINSTQKEFSNYSTNEQSYLKQLLNDFDDLILGRPDELENFINRYDQSIIGDYKVGKFGKKYKLNTFGEDILAIFGYDKYFRTKVGKGIWLSKMINIKSCPYCNVQYTLVVDKMSKKSQAKFQFDHYYSKKKYPYLSLSLFNLIPSCANCNLAKGNEDFRLSTHYHPYSSNLHDRAKFNAHFGLDIDKLSIGDTSDLTVEIKFQSISSKYKGLVDNHNDIFNIEGIYARMEYEVKALLRKYIVYKKNQYSLMSIKGLFPDNEVFNDYMLGTYSVKDAIMEKPLTKFTQDIARDLKLIK